MQVTPVALNFLHDTRFNGAYTQCIDFATNSAGIVFVAMVCDPPGGVDTQYAVICRINPDNSVQELKRYNAHGSRTWLHQHGIPYAEDNGKYGRIAIEARDKDLIVGFTMRIEKIQTNFFLIERNLAV